MGTDAQASVWLRRIGSVVEALLLQKINAVLRNSILLELDCNKLKLTVIVCVHNVELY